jgi:hypothetical protein
MHSLLIALVPLLMGAASPETGQAVPTAPAAQPSPAAGTATPKATATQVTTATQTATQAETAGSEAAATGTVRAATTAAETAVVTPYVNTADAEATPSVATSPTAHEAPWYALYDGTRFGVGLDVGAPTGAGLVGIFRPWKCLRVNAGLAYDVIGFGVRGGLSFVPWHWAVSPSLNLDFGHFFSGDASMFVSNPTPTQKSLLNQLTFDYVSPQLGLEFGSQRRFAFYVRGGLTYVGDLSLAGKDVTAEAQRQIQDQNGDGQFVSAGDLSIRALVPSFSIGFNLFLD